MKSFIKFLEEDPSNSDLIQYQIEEINQMIQNTTKNRDQFKKQTGDYNEWMTVRYEAQIEILESYLTSLKYKLRKL